MYLDIIAFNYTMTCRLNMEVETAVAFVIIQVRYITADIWMLVVLFSGLFEMYNE